MRNSLKSMRLMMLLVVIACGSGCVGWGSSGLPPRLSSAERMRIKGAHLPLTVGVERFKAPAYSESLREALQRTKLFDRVDDLDQFSEPPSLIARVERRIYGTPTIPMLTLVTFGIIPTFVQEESGESFSLSPPDRPGERVVMEYSYRGRTTLGWIALLDVLHPNRTVLPLDPEKSGRFRDRLKLCILDRADALKR